MFFNALDDAGGDVCQCCLCLCLRGEQQMNVISWRTWSRITTTRTDPGSIPTGTWLWREQASINRVRRPARARRPSCFCPCQPSAEGEMLSNTERERQTTDHWLTNLTPRWAHPVRKKRFYLGTLPKQMHLESITGFICSCSVRDTSNILRRDSKSLQYHLRSNFPKYFLISLYSLEQGQ